MGCGSSAPSSAVENGRTVRAGAARPRRGAGGSKNNSDDGIPTEMSPRLPVKPPLAFEISLDEAGSCDLPVAEVTGQGLIRRHPPLPPRVLQRLHPVSETSRTLEDLQSKMESAEKRRMSILQNRIASANKASRQSNRMLSEIRNDTIDDETVNDLVELKNSINNEGKSPV